MYSKEDKERILADYRASGLSIRAFCNIPQNPSCQSIRTWERQAQRGELDVPQRSVRGKCKERIKHTRYPQATKREAVRLMEAGMMPGQVAKRLGVLNSSSVTGWYRKAQDAKMAPRNEVPMTAKKKIDRRVKESLPLRQAREMSRAELEAAYAESQLEKRVLLGVMFDPKVPCLENLSNRRKVELGQNMRRELGISLSQVLMCLKISRSTYYDNLKAMETTPLPDERKAEVGALVRASFEASFRRYGYRRVHADLKATHPEACVSEGEVRDAMKEENMQARKTRARRYSSYKGEPDSRPANLPLKDDGKHDFTCDVPGKLVVTDVTEFKVGATKVYLSPIIDCFDGMPVAHTSSLHPDSKLCDSSLQQALEKGPIDVMHSDGGICYRANSWKGICENNDIIRSMSRKGCCGDNARAEGFFGTLKEEFYNGRDWSRTTPEQFVAELDEYIRWYREDRLKLFVEGNDKVYDTLEGRRAKLGLAA